MDAKELRALAEKHAPKAWHEKISTEQGMKSCPLFRGVTAGQTVNVVVLCVDIRSSTALMREAINPHKFAAILTHFVDEAQRIIQESNGWFDNFTGDGFLAYWPIDPETVNDDTLRIARFCSITLDYFRDHLIGNFKENSRNFPSTAGLSIGIDAGPLNLVKVAGYLTVVGPPVVGAVRMVSLAAPYEILANVSIGHHLETNPNIARDLRLKAVRRMIKRSKEYPHGQEVYRLVL
jgi:class 3 adenylate cyclase